MHQKKQRAIRGGMARSSFIVLFRKLLRTAFMELSIWNPSPSGSTRGGHMDVPFFEERGRWRQPDEGSAGAVNITLALRPYPHPNPSPSGRGALSSLRGRLQLRARTR